jgi:hypothetical protein
MGVILIISGIAFDSSDWRIILDLLNDFPFHQLSKPEILLTLPPYLGFGLAFF